jgi:hypothetical protein
MLLSTGQASSMSEPARALVLWAGAGLCALVWWLGRRSGAPDSGYTRGRMIACKVAAFAFTAAAVLATARAL